MHHLPISALARKTLRCEFVLVEFFTGLIGLALSNVEVVLSLCTKI